MFGIKIIYIAASHQRRMFFFISSTVLCSKCFYLCAAFTCTQQSNPRQSLQLELFRHKHFLLWKYQVPVSFYF